RPSRPGATRQTERRGAGLHQAAPALAARANGLPVDPGYEAANARVWPHRLAGRAGRVDRREVPDVERLLWRCGAKLLEGYPAHERDALLGDGRDQLVVLAVLRARPSPVAPAGWQAHHGPHSVRRVPSRDLAATPSVGRAKLQHPALDR